MAKAKRRPTITGLTAYTQKLYDVLNDQPEFIKIVVGAAYLDACLGAMLLQYFIPGSSIVEKVLDHEGALGSFAARTDLCYCLGLITKAMYQDLGKIGQIRNLAAHDHLMRDFNDPEIAHLSGELEAGGEVGRLPAAFQAPRNRYVFTCSLVATRLILTTMGLEHRKPLDPPKVGQSITVTGR